ncbi:MAG: hypothetical protein N4A49_06915 [Marinifilaceae bacterium]|nr:hypothetical protein [Marinifilaceae bacterium]
MIEFFFNIIGDLKEGIPQLEHNDRVEQGYSKNNMIKKMHYEISHNAL